MFVNTIMYCLDLHPPSRHHIVYDVQIIGHPDIEQMNKTRTGLFSSIQHYSLAIQYPAWTAVSHMQWPSRSPCGVVTLMSPNLFLSTFPSVRP